LYFNNNRLIFQRANGIAFPLLTYFLPQLCPRRSTKKFLRLDRVVFCVDDYETLLGLYGIVIFLFISNTHHRFTHIWLRNKKHEIFQQFSFKLQNCKLFSFYYLVLPKPLYHNRLHNTVHRIDNWY